MLDFLSTLTFYLALVFGYGSALILVFNIGRLGMEQIMHWLSGAPLPNPNAQSDQVDAFFEVLGVPTSLEDVAISLTPFGWTKSFGVILKPFYSVWGRTYAYGATILGRLFGRAWFLVGIPALVLNIILDKAGHDYTPVFLELVGLPSEIALAGIAIGGLVLVYLLGRLISSPQRQFNDARLAYERIVMNKGYWFDHRLDAGYYADAYNALAHILRRYDKVAKWIRGDQRKDELTVQRMMGLEYQKALALCTLGRFEEADQALQRAEQCRIFPYRTNIWEAGEAPATASQDYFLQGEIAYVMGKTDHAKELFEQSLAIDTSLSDSQGVTKNQERLTLFAS